MPDKFRKNVESQLVSWKTIKECVRNYIVM
jgi:hypothetical protein